VSANCCLVSPGKGSQDWRGTALRVVLCCWPKKHVDKESKSELTLVKPKLYHFYEYGRTRQLLTLRQSSQHLSSAQFTPTLSILQIPDGLAAFSLPSQITFSTCCLCLWAQILHGKYQPEVSFFFFPLNILRNSFESCKTGKTNLKWLFTSHI